jgi:hypothetical protein
MGNHARGSSNAHTIDDFQSCITLSNRQLDVDATSVRVLQHTIESFLGNPIQLLLLLR